MTKHSKLLITALSLSLSCPAFSANNDGWTYGIGTELFGLHINGDAGFNTETGPISFDASLSTEDVSDLMKSAFGFDGFAKKGPWIILYSLGKLKLGDSVSGMVDDAGTIASLDFTNKGISAEISVVYEFSTSVQRSFGVLFGLAYTSQEYDLTAEVNGSQLFKVNVDENWTDFIVGLTYTHILSPTTTWNSRFDVGSQGRVFIETGVTWIFSKNWETQLFTSFKSFDYENKTRGDADWYMYDANEAGLGLSISYLF